MNCFILENHQDYIILLMVYVLIILIHILKKIYYWNNSLTYLNCKYDLIKLYINFTINYCLNVSWVLINKRDNQCYNNFLVNITNCLITIPMELILLNISNYVFTTNNFIYLVSGNYSKYPSVINLEYLIQLCVWIIISVSSQVIVHYCILYAGNQNLISVIGYIFSYMHNINIIKYLNIILLSTVYNLIRLNIHEYRIKGIGIIDEINFDSLEPGHCDGEIDEIYNRL